MKTTTFKALAIAIAMLPIFSNAAMLTRQLEMGMSGADISTLQTYLAQDVTIYPQGLVTGYFGFLTKSAVSNFQDRNGISRVGRVGPQTLAFINSIWVNGNNGNNNTNNYQAVIGPLSLSTSNNQVNVSWNTSVNTTAAVYYSSSPLVLNEATEYSPFTISGGMVSIMNSDLRTSHSGSITGLNNNTVYYYVVYVKDAAGNESITLPSTFQTTN
jgi:hypothetical protein